MSTIPLPIVNRDGDIGTDATVTRGGELVGSKRTRLAGGVITSAFAPWFVNQSVGGGSAVIAAAAIEVHSGVVVAPRGRVDTFHRGRVIMPMTNHWVGVVSFNDVLTPGGRYRLGVFDDLDGFFFEILTGASPVGRVVSRKAGVDAVVSPPLGQKQPVTVDTNRHAYLIRYLITAADYVQDGQLRHTLLSQTAAPLISNADLFGRIEAENIGGAGADFVATFGNMSIVRIGELADINVATAARVAMTNVSVTIANNNPMRRGLRVHNESNKLLFIKYGATASPTDYNEMLAPDQTTVIEYSGRVDAILSAASFSSFAVVTALSEV